MKNSIVWPALLLLISFSTAQARDGGVASNGNLWIRMDREACYGFCPVYQLEIFRDGRVRFNGEKFTLETGEQNARLNDEQIAALKNLIEQSDIFKLNENCCSCMEMTDAPTVNIEIHHGNYDKKIEHYHGCLKSPGWLSNFENQVEELSGAIQWVGTAKQRKGHKWKY